MHRTTALIDRAVRENTNSRAIRAVTRAAIRDLSLEERRQIYAELLDLAVRRQPKHAGIAVRAGFLKRWAGEMVYGWIFDDQIRTGVWTPRTATPTDWIAAIAIQSRRSNRHDLIEMGAYSDDRNDWI